MRPILVTRYTHRLCFDKPEADPGAEDDESEGCVDLQQEEARLPLEQELQVHPRVVPIPGPCTEQSIITVEVTTGLREISQFPL